MKKEDGGPAFPCNMTDAEAKELTQCGFPVAFKGGMTLRDYFAGQALADAPAIVSGMIADFDARATWAYRMADAMLKERSQ